MNPKVKSETSYGHHMSWEKLSAMELCSDVAFSNRIRTPASTSNVTLGHRSLNDTSDPQRLSLMRH